MNRRTLGVACALVLVIVPHLARASAAVDALLLAAPDPRTLRAQLLEFASTAPDSAVAGKGAALYWTGVSYARDGRADSALVLFERAVAMRGGAAERDAYVDALFDRGRGGDAARALEVLEPRLRAALKESERDIAVTKGRQAWALYSQNRGDSALALMRSVERWLLDEMTVRNRDWRYRLGLLELEHGTPAKSAELLLPLALLSRFQDRDVMGMLRDASDKGPRGSDMATLLRQELIAGDDAERKALSALGARRITFTADDGFPVGAMVYPGFGSKTRRAIVAITDLEEPFDAYDSLAAGLARAGYAVLVMEPRGTGFSVTPTCPLPETWRGREAEMHQRVARDAVLALRALAGAARVDTSSYLIAGSLGSASIAVEAATLDPRARAILMLSPDPSPVDNGPMRARVQRLKLPVYFEIPVYERRTVPLAEALYQAADPRVSRIVESEIIGSAARVFRRDVSALPRLLQWLDESWSVARKAGRKR